MTNNNTNHAIRYELPPGHFLFTSESVSQGHPDKICDYISDSILDACLEVDPDSKVGIIFCTPNRWPVRPLSRIPYAWCLVRSTAMPILRMSRSFVKPYRMLDTIPWVY